MALSREESTILEHLLIEDEGLKNFPYLDCCGRPWRKCLCEEKGKLTIGIGRNLDDVGVSDAEAIALQMDDVNKMTALVERSFPWFLKLNTPRRIVIVSMAFNLGLDGLKGFHKMINCVASGDFQSAANEMLKSKWATQVNGRSKRLALIMKTGQF